MRLVLDVHVSGPVIGGGLIARGPDVLAVDRTPALPELEDPDLSRVARAEGRIMITANAGVVMEAATAWAHAGESHAGLILITYRVSRDRFGHPMRGSESLLEGTSQARSRDRSRRLSPPHPLR